jgi:hypothetical protein
VSNTPLTDMLLISWDMDVPSYVMTRHARFIELKLNAANDRIKRLEEAGDRMRLYCADPDDCFAWDKAKEAKL